MDRSVGNRPRSSLREAVNFYIVTFTISWLIWGLVIALPSAADWAPLLIILGAYGPLVAALLLNYHAGGREMMRSWLRSITGVRNCWRWLLIGGLLLPLLIALIHAALYHFFVGPAILSVTPPWYWAASTVPLNILVLFWMSSAMEEFGWQGFALPRLAGNLHPLLACLLHGIIWATWHLPLYLTGSWTGDDQTIWHLYAITITLTPTMFWLTQQAKGSVLPAVLFHAATNHYSALYAQEQIYPIFAEPLADYFNEIKIGIYLTVALVLIVRTRGLLGWQKGRAPVQKVQLNSA